VSLDRFIFCSCTHPLDAHTETGCARCACSSTQRIVIDTVLERERIAIHAAWLRGSADDGAPGVRA